MRSFAILIMVLLLSASVTSAQTDTGSVSSPASPSTSVPPARSTTPSPPGTVQSDVPAATTGTAPIDSSMPSGTGTTGTSGTTMEEAEENNESNSSFLWVLLGALALAGLIYLLRKKRRQT